MARPENLPPPILPLVYFGFGHLSLVLAFLIPALDPGSISGFFFHPKMFTVVHLVTLGWVTTSILGATYIVGPMALQMPLRSGWIDRAVCGAVLVGIAGVVAHFWLKEYSGIAWSGGLLALAFLVMAVRVIRALTKSKGPRAVRAHIGFAYGNLCLAAVLGTLLAINRSHTILPGSHLIDVYGHAHVAMVGWAVLMVIGMGYRLLPMYLPAAPPKGATVWLSAVLPEIGVLGLGVTFFYRPSLVPGFAMVLVAGLGAFFFNVVRMLREPRPPPVKLRRPDPGMLHALQALVYLFACVPIGLFLAFSKETQPSWIMVYGVCGLVGFLGQIVLGIGMRLLPMFAWLEAWAGKGYVELPTSPHEMPARPLQFLALGLWTVDVPLFGSAWVGTRGRASH